MAWATVWAACQKMRKLLEFDFSAAVDGVSKIGAAKDEVSDERTVECKVAVAP